MISYRSFFVTDVSRKSCKCNRIYLSKYLAWLEYLVNILELSMTFQNSSLSAKRQCIIFIFISTNIKVMFNHNWPDFGFLGFFFVWLLPLCPLTLRVLRCFWLGFGVMLFAWFIVCSSESLDSKATTPENNKFNYLKNWESPYDVVSAVSQHFLQKFFPNHCIHRNQVRPLPWK